jgi:hypothetical protein
LIQLSDEYKNKISNLRANDNVTTLTMLLKITTDEIRSNIEEKYHYEENIKECELKIKECKLKIEEFELKIKEFELKIIECELKIINIKVMNIKYSKSRKIAVESNKNNQIDFSRFRSDYGAIGIEYKSEKEYNT